MGIEELINGCRNQDLPLTDLVAQIRERNEGFVTDTDSVIVQTGKYTGRSPGDKFIIENVESHNEIWWGCINQPLSGEHFREILTAQCQFLRDKDTFLEHLSAGIPGAGSLSLLVITETAWHSLFSRNLFKPANADQEYHPGNSFILIHTPSLVVNPARTGTNSGVFIVINFEERMILIGGTSYAGEIKKAVFTVLNRALPRNGILSMHCSANLGRDGDTALFFGLSGTGKTTLSTVPDRELIGDDEHGWGEAGIINLEGGCYAKTIGLQQSKEPGIWRAVHSSGSLLENVDYDPASGRLDFDSARITENTRAAYALDVVSRLNPNKFYPHPGNIFFLTADAFGIIPPISSLDHEQAVFHFLSGYTAKVAGTERGTGKDPRATFSTCYAEPFLPLPPEKYADMLKKKIQEFKPRIWLVNTGWIGGAYGIGRRIQLEHTRAMISAALRNSVTMENSFVEPVFGLRVPGSIPGVPDAILKPRNLWEDKASYDEIARTLKGKFLTNASRFPGVVYPGL